MFYLAWLPPYILHAIRAGKLFYSRRLYLTFLGLDGYFLYRGPNYYILGEWFLGAIVMIYLLYPLLLRAFRASCWGTMAAAAALYVWEVHSSLFLIYSFRNLISCILSFLCGMLFFKYRNIWETGGRKDWRHWLPAYAPAGVLAAAMLFVKLPFTASTAGHLMGACAFLLLYGFGKHAMKRPRIKRAAAWLSGISYGIFLTHHFFIVHILKYRNPENIWYGTGLLVLSLSISLAAAVCLKRITGRVLNSAPFRKAERRILEKGTKGEPL